MRAAGEESINLMTVFGRCIAAKYYIPIKRLAIYNLYTRFFGNELTTVLQIESSVEMTIINSMGSSDPITIFNDDLWRVHGNHPTPPNLKMICTDNFDKEGALYLTKTRGLERMYIVSKRPKDSCKTDSTTATPTTPSTIASGAPASANSTPIAMSNRICQNLASEYIAAIQASHSTLRHLLLPDLWALSDETLFQLCKSLPNLEQFGFACAVPSLELMRTVMSHLPKASAIRLLVRPGYETGNKFDINDPEMHIFVIATEFWRPEYKNLKYVGLGDDLVFKLGSVYYPPKKDTIAGGNDNSMNGKRAGPIRKVEAVSRESVKDVEIWGLDTTEFHPTFS